MESSPTSLAPALLETPDSKLAAALNGYAAELGQLVGIAAAANRNAVLKAIAMGELLEVLFRRHEGQFAEWLSLNIIQDENGAPIISDRTARVYRQLWRRRAELFPPDDSNPAPRSIADALRKLGIIPDSEEIEADPAASKPLFRLAFTLPPNDPATWPPLERREFLTKAEPIVRAWQALQAISET